MRAYFQSGISEDTIDEKLSRSSKGDNSSNPDRDDCGFLFADQAPNKVQKQAGRHSIHTTFEPRINYPGTHSLCKEYNLFTDVRLLVTFRIWKYIEG